MLIVNGKAVLRIDGEIVKPGATKEVPENLGKKLVGVGLATVEPSEKATMPKPKPRHIGGGWYLLPDGQKVRKKDLKDGD